LKISKTEASSFRKVTFTHWANRGAYGRRRSFSDSAVITLLYIGIIGACRNNVIGASASAASMEMSNGKISTAAKTLWSGKNHSEYRFRGK
jgi:hypothetical protein